MAIIDVATGEPVDWQEFAEALRDALALDAEHRDDDHSQPPGHRLSAHK